MDILVTGATGNVGSEVLAALAGRGHTLWAGLRDPLGTILPAGIQPYPVDFSNGPPLARGFDAIFLMRPPHLADPALFRRFLAPIDRQTLIVFLSVAGADRQPWLPHARIEKVIRQMGFAHVFVRPGYFMDNLLTTLAPELRQNGRIYLPAGRLRLDWVSVRDVAAVCAQALLGKVTTSAAPVSSGQLTGFDTVCATLNKQCGTAFRYQPASLVGFVRHSRHSGLGWPFILVMLLLHFLPRLGRQPRPQPSDLPRLLGRNAETLADFATRNQAEFRALAGIG